VDAFFELLGDPDSVAWKYDGSTTPPPSVADRGRLSQLLLEQPELLDDNGIYWCLRHSLSFTAPYRGYARWRRRRDGSWTDPSP